MGNITKKTGNMHPFGPNKNDFVSESILNRNFWYLFYTDKHVMRYKIQII